MNKKLLLLASCALGCLLSGTALMSQSTFSLTEAAADTNVSFGTAIDASSIASEHLVPSSNPSGKYLYQAPRQANQWSLTAPITQKKDVVLEFEWISVVGASESPWFKLGPWGRGDAWSLARDFHFGYSSGGLNPNYIWRGGDVADNVTFVDLTTNTETVVAGGGDYAGYTIGTDLRYRITMETDGDLLIAKKTIGSTEEFVDSLKIVNYAPAPEEVSETNPCYIHLFMLNQQLLGDMLVRYADGEMIRHYNFDTDINVAWYGGTLPIGQTNKMQTPTPGAQTLYSPMLKNVGDGERLVSKFAVGDVAVAGQDVELFTMSGNLMIRSLSAGTYLKFLAGLPVDNAMIAATGEGVAAVVDWHDGANGWTHGYGSGESLYPSDCGGLPLGNNSFIYKGKHKADGTFGIEFYVNGNIVGGWTTTESFVGDKIGIAIEGGDSEIAINSLTYSIANPITDGEDLAINFNTYPGSTKPAVIDSDEWYMASTDSVSFVDNSVVKGLSATDGTLFFEGTTNGTVFAAKKEYNDFVLEFDYLNIAEKPAIAESYIHGYSPLGVQIGMNGYAAWGSASKLITFNTDDTLAVTVLDGTATAPAATSLVASASGWRSVKIVAENNTITIFCKDVEAEGDYTQVVSFACTKTSGYVGFVTTECAWWKIDNVRITNIDMTGSANYTPKQFVDVYGNATVTATANNELGTVVGGGEFAIGTQTTLTANVTAEHAHFVGWKVNGETVSTELAYTFTVIDDVEIIAEFAKDSYTLNVEYDDTKASITYPKAVEYGTEVTFTALMTDEYNFVAWKDMDGNVLSTELTYTVTVTANLSIKAEFAIKQYTVTATAENGTVTGAGTYDLGAEVTLTATAAENYVFVKWTKDGEDVSTEATLTFTLEENVEYVAVFAKVQYTVTATAENGTVTGAGTYDVGTEIALTATAAENYVFVKWTKDGEDIATEATLTFTLEENVEYVAVFAKVQYTVTATAENGTVTGAGTYDVGTEITLTAMAAENYVFVKWTKDGEDVATEATLTFTLEENVEYVAVFEEEPTSEVPGGDDSEEPSTSEQPSGDTSESDSANSFGCGSSIGLAAGAMALSMTLVVVFMIKRKEDN